MRIFVEPNRKDSDPFEVRAKGAHLRKLCREFGATPIGEDAESFTVKLKTLDKADLQNFLEMTGARGVELGPEDAALLAHNDPIGAAAIEKEMSAANFDGRACIDELGAKIDYLGEAVWRIPADSPDAAAFDALLAEVEAPVAEPTPQVNDWDATLASMDKQLADMEARGERPEMLAPGMTSSVSPHGIIRR